MDRMMHLMGRCRNRSSAEREASKTESDLESVLTNVERTTIVVPVRAVHDVVSNGVNRSL